MIRKILKTTKHFEIVQVRTTRKDKLVDHLPDEQGVFRHEWLSDFKKEVVITFQFLNIEQKEYIFKLPIVEKVQRLKFLKEISGKCFKA